MNLMRLLCKQIMAAQVCIQWITRAIAGTLTTAMARVAGICCQFVFPVFIAWLLSSAVFAQSADITESPYDEYQLSAEANINVANDLMTVHLVASETGSDPVQLANKINATVGWAVGKLGRFTSIKKQTFDYQTQPQIEENGTRVNTWLASQSIQLETDNFVEAGQAIELLQERLQVLGIRHKAKTDTLEQAEEQLINAALKAFKRRAMVVQTNMGARGYRIMNLSVNTEGMRQQSQQQNHTRSATSRWSESSLPAIAPASRPLRVHIDGRIKLE